MTYKSTTYLSALLVFFLQTAVAQNQDSVKKVSGVLDTTSIESKTKTMASKKIVSKTNQKEFTGKKESRTSKVIMAKNRAFKTSESQQKNLSKTRELADKFPRETRADKVEKSTRSHDFWFYSASSTLMRDIDQDGFFSEFRIYFDVDTVYDWADVYAKLYISRDGGPWELYYETRTFEVNGETDADKFKVTTILHQNFPSGSYDVLIDLYEEGYSGVVATISAEDDVDLFDLPLEDRDNEGQVFAGFSLYDVETYLISDIDNDGFYSAFEMAFDIDTEYSNAEIYLQLYFLNEDNEWELEYTSDDFIIEGNSSNDVLEVEFEWLSGYQPGYYDFKVVVRDSLSDEHLLETFSEYQGLNEVPLESKNNDNSDDVVRPPVDNGNDTSSRGTGGGGVGVVLMSLLGLALFRRKQYNIV